MRGRCSSRGLAPRAGTGQQQRVTDLTHLARPGAVLTLRVTPRARRNAVTVEGCLLRIHVTDPPEDGRATRAVLRLLARAMKVAPSRLTVIRGQTARDKVVRLD